MTHEFDSPWKEALERYFQQFLALLFPAIHQEIDWSRGYELLNTELEQIVREAELGKHWADVLVKVHRLNGEEICILIHVEVQAQPDERFPERMFIYHYRIFDRYRLPLVSLAVLADEQPNWRPAHYERNLCGFRLRIDYPIIKLHDFQPRIDLLESEENVFGPIVVAHLQSQATRRDPDQRMNWKFRLFRGLRQRNLSAKDVRELLRIVDWFLDLPKQQEQQFVDQLQVWEKEQAMPFIPSYERKAHQEGLDEGERKGLREGRRQGLLKGIEKFLRANYGTEGSALMSFVEQINDPGELETLLENVSSGQTLEEFRAKFTRK